jgi:hypothetical protein
MDAYQAMLTETTTAWAPWHVVPADHKWVTRAVVASILRRRIEALDLRYPEVTSEKREEIAAAKRQLEPEA